MTFISITLLPGFTLNNGYYSKTSRQENFGSIRAMTMTAETTYLHVKKLTSNTKRTLISVSIMLLREECEYCNAMQCVNKT